MTKVNPNNKKETEAETFPWKIFISDNSFHCLLNLTESFLIYMKNELLFQSENVHNLILFFKS